MDRSLANQPFDAIRTVHASRAGALAVAAAAVGLMLVWAAGFAGPEVLHQVAHDARHSFAFPCH